MQARGNDRANHVTGTWGALFRICAAPSLAHAIGVLPWRRDCAYLEATFSRRNRLFEVLVGNKRFRTFPHLTFAELGTAELSAPLSEHNEEVIAMHINLLPLEIILGLQGAASLIMFLILMSDDPSTKD